MSENNFELNDNQKFDKERNSVNSKMLDSVGEHVQYNKLNMPKQSSNNTRTGRFLSKTSRKFNNIKLNINRLQNKSKGLILTIKALLLNPIFYVGLFVFFLAIFLIANSTTLGPANISSLACTGGAPEIGSAQKPNERQQIIADFISNHGWNKQVAWSGALAIEKISQGSGNYNIDCNDNVCAENKSNFGLLSFNSTHSKILLQKANTENSIITSSSFQLRYIIEFMNQNEKEFLNVKTPSDFAKLFGSNTNTSDEDKKLIDSKIKDKNGKTKLTNCQVPGSGCLANKWNGAADDKIRCGASSSTAPTGLVEFAWWYSQPPGSKETTAKANMDPMGSDGFMQSSTGKPEYRQAKQMAADSGHGDPTPNLFASCDRSTVTAIIATGYDPNIPWGGVQNIHEYLINGGADKWKKIDCNSGPRPGDIVLYKKGSNDYQHIVMYIGQDDTGNLEGCIGGCFIEGSYGDYESTRVINISNLCTYGEGYDNRIAEWYRCESCQAVNTVNEKKEQDTKPIIQPIPRAPGL